MTNLSRDQRGSVTLTVVFLTCMAFLLLAFADNARVFRSDAVALSERSSEQAFYAAQSCLEEGYFQLRTSASYTGGTLTVGDSTCTTTVTPAALHSPDGQLAVVGSAGSTKRGIASSYTGAGPEISHHKTEIFHAIDRSGSMAEYVCDDPIWTNQPDCLLHSSQWIQKAVAAKGAAKAFDLNVLLPGNTYDSIGLVSYSTNASLDSGLQTNAVTLNNIIDHMPGPADYTNFDDSITLATSQLPVVLGTATTRAIILLTDGQPTAYHPGRSCVVAGVTLDTNDCAKHWGSVAADAAKAQGILLFTIGFGNDTQIDTGYMESISSVINGQTMFFRPTSTGLNDVYSHIADILTQYNIHQGSWNEQ